jgi:hypothetical protein
VLQREWLLVCRYFLRRLKISYLSSPLLFSIYSVTTDILGQFCMI